MTELDHLARTSAYFDGELPEAEHADVIAHLAGCAECQALLGTAVQLDAALAGAPRVAAPSHLRWWLAGGAVAAAAAVTLWLVVRPTPPATKAPQVAIEVPKERALEVRFSGELFAPYRPRAVVRGSELPRETISLATLAQLEQRGDVRDLVAALASSGDVARAQETAARLPAGPLAESDRAALALLAKDPETALAHAYAAGSLGAWNLALAARDLGLPHVEATAFHRVAAAGEAGWSREAQELANDPSLSRDQAFSIVQHSAAAMLDGGPPLDAPVVAAFPAYARIEFYDALRVARSRDEALRLMSLALALDGASEMHTCAAAVERVAAADFTVRGKLVADYRALVARTLPADRVAPFIAALAKAGPAAADLYVGAAILGGEAGKRLDQLRAVVAPWHDPWFDLFFEHEAQRAAVAASDVRAEPALVAALAGCANPAWAMRCGTLEQDLAQLLFATGRDDEAEVHARAAVEAQRRAAMPQLTANALALLADIHRRHGRFALARAELEEVVLVIGDADPALRRYATIGRANVAFAARDLDAARALLPAPDDPCCPGTDVIGFATAVDLARLTGDPRDRTKADAWLASARAQGDPLLASIGDVRLGGGSPGELEAAARALPIADTTGRRTYAFTTLISQAGDAGDWKRVVALAREEMPIADAPCIVVASSDDDRVTLAAQTPDGARGATTKLAATPLIPDSLTGALDHCDGIAVIARPPLHGRGDLLPAKLPWWYAGHAHAPAAAPAVDRRTLEVIDARPPDPSLPALPAVGHASEKFAVTLAGADATPARVLAALADATYAEIHVHGLVAAATHDAAYLALSPEPNGRYALTAGAIRQAHFASAPVVLLGACRAANVAPLQRERWSLPDALLDAGARDVIAADIEIPDAEVRAAFDDLHHRIAAGTPVARALAEVRAAHGGWTAHLMLFQ